MNQLRSSVTEVTPEQLMSNKIPKRQIENEIEFPTQPETHQREELIQLVARKIRNKALKREENKKQGRKINFEVRQEILVKNHKLSNSEENEIKKLFNIYEGPYCISKIINNTTVVIQNLDTGNEEVISRDHIRPYIRGTES